MCVSVYSNFNNMYDMILNGKSLEDFTKWSEETHDDCGIGQIAKRLFYIESLDDYKFINTEHYIYNIGDNMLNELIIEFFDSVGIILNVYYNTYSENYVYEVININKILSTDKTFKTRQQATKQAIITSNSIYNELSNKIPK